VLVELAGQHGLKQLVPIIREAATNDQKKSSALIALVKLGDAAAIEQLREIIAGTEPAVDVWWDLARNPDAVRAARIQSDQLRALTNKHAFDRSADKDLLLAYFGEADGLLTRIRSYVRDDVPKSHDEEAEITRVLMSLSTFGDDRYLKALDDLFDKLRSDSQRIDCSNAILQILGRQHTAAASGLKSGN